jgi:hypothetical protein
LKRRVGQFGARRSQWLALFANKQRNKLLDTFLESFAEAIQIVAALFKRKERSSRRIPASPLRQPHRVEPWTHPDTGRTRPRLPD